VIGGDALVEGERTVGWYAVADLDARNVSMHKVSWPAPRMTHT
jgi:hypothetical protein